MLFQQFTLRVIEPYLLYNRFRSIETCPRNGRFTVRGVQDRFMFLRICPVMAIYPIFGSVAKPFSRSSSVGT